MQLINTFAPLSDEPGLGYYRRLSSENGLSGWRHLARLAGLSASRSGLLSRPEHVAELLGLPADWARQATIQEDMARGWTGTRRTTRDAVCPHCLCESPHLRASWEHAYVVACPKHEVLLVDTCDVCGQGLSPHRDHIDLCGCGRRLSEMRTPLATAGLLWLAALIATRGASSGRWSPTVSGAPVDVVVELVHTLCLLHDPAVPPPRKNTATPRSVTESIRFLRPLDGLLADWPRGFEAHVSARIAAGNPEARTLNSLLGKWYLQLTAVATGNALTPFLEAVARVASAEFTGLMGLDRAASVMTQQATHLIASQAAARIGIHRDTLVNRIKDGKVQHRTRKFGTRGQAYEVPVEEVNAIIEAREQWVTEGIAGAMLGVPGSVLQLLLDAELLLGDANWRQDVRKGGAIQLESLSSLADVLRRAPSRAPISAGRRILLRELTGRRGDKKAIVAALRAIAAGEIRPLRTSALPGGNEYALADISEHFSRPVAEAGTSLQELAEITGWKWESIDHWASLGLLEFSVVKVRGQVRRIVMPHQLLAFTRTYTPLADLARQLGTKSSALSARLEGIEVLGAQTLPSGSRRGGLLRTADLARKALQPAAAKEE